MTSLMFFGGEEKGDCVYCVICEVKNKRKKNLALIIHLKPAHFVH